jgi:hypothetical protein
MPRTLKNMLLMARNVLFSIASLFSREVITSALDIRKLRRPQNLYALLLFLIFLAGIVCSHLLPSFSGASPKNWARYFFIPYAAYFITAIAGLTLYKKYGRRIALITQVGFIALSVILFTSSDISLISHSLLNVMRIFNTVLFILCTNLLFFYYEITLFKEKSMFHKFNSWQYGVSAFVIILLSEVPVYLMLPKNSNILILSIILVLSCIIACSVLYYYLFTTHRTLYLIIFQSSYLASLVSMPFIEEYKRNLFDQSTFVIYIFITWGFTTVSVLYFLVNKLFFKHWKGRLVAGAESSAKEKPISIYPEDSTYLDVRRNAAWLTKFIETSDGGVIGLTGLRGAGKSALLHKVISDLQDRYFTMHITSPVHSSDRMEFFMMICREVCTKVINNIEEKVFRLKVSSSALAQKELLTSIKIILLLLILGVGLWFFPTSGINLLQKEYRTGRQEYEPSQEFTNFFPLIDYLQPILRTVDSTCITSLIREIDQYQRDTASTFDAAVIVPDSWGPALKLLPVHSAYFDIKLFHEHFSRTYFTYLNYMSDYDTLAIRTFESQYRDEVMYTFYYYQMISKGTMLTTDMARLIGMKASQTDSYMHKYDTYLGNKEIDTTSLRYPLLWLSGYNIVFFEFAKIDAYSSDIGTMLGVTSRFAFTPDTPSVNITWADPPKLMSWILLEGYYRDAVGPQAAHFPLQRGAPLRHVRDVLAAYRETLYPAATTAAPPATFSYAKLESLAYNNLWMILLAVSFVLVLLGPFFLRRTNNFMYRFMNFNAYGLLLRSRDFLRVLSYTESKGKSGEVSLPKGLRFSMNRTLTERNLTLPALTNQFIEFVKEAAELFNRKIIIAIDELDKIDDPAVVKHILQEVKGALFVKNTYYLISISEDAARSFENRLSTGRDIIESTFDELITLHRLDCNQAWQIIERRLAGGGQSSGSDSPAAGPQKSQKTLEQERTNAEAITLHAGGIPREIIRNLRDIIIEFKEFAAPSPVQVCVTLFTKKIEDYLSKIDEIQIPGRSSLRLYRKLKDIQRLLAGRASTLKQSAFTIMKLCEESIAIIDPQKLRYSVTSTSDETLRVRYKAIETDIKTLTELLIRARILLFYSTGEYRDAAKASEIQQRILNAYDALDSSPALAQHILNEQPG